jgi:hypothetical protein
LINHQAIYRSDFYNIKGLMPRSSIFKLRKDMKETKTILVIVALLTIASIAYVAMYPYLTPENIQITPNRGPLDLGTSIGFIITGHLHSRSTTFTYNWQISNLGINLTYGGGSMILFLHLGYTTFK